MKPYYGFWLCPFCVYLQMTRSCYFINEGSLVREPNTYKEGAMDTNNNARNNNQPAYVGSAIQIGRESDWYRRNEKGVIISRDAYGNPVADQEIWAKARKTGNGSIPEGYTVGGSFAAVAFGVGFISPAEGILSMRRRKNYAAAAGRDVPPQALFDQGHAMENQVAEQGMAHINEKEFAPKGLWGRLINDTRMFRAGAKDEKGKLKYPNVIADVDRIIEVHAKDPEGPVVGYFLMEVKTVQSHGFDKPEWQMNEENVLGEPLKYAIQQHLYMGVLDGVMGSYTVAGENGTLRAKEDVLVRFIPRDKDTSEYVLKRAQELSDFAKTNKDVSLWKAEYSRNELVDAFGKYAEVTPREPIEDPKNEKESEKFKKAILSYMKAEGSIKKHGTKKRTIDSKIKSEEEKAKSLLLKKLGGKQSVRVPIKEGEVLPNGKSVKTDSYLNIIAAPKQDQKTVFSAIKEFRAADLKEERPDLWKKVGHILDGEPIVQTTGVTLSKEDKVDLEQYKVLSRSGKVDIRYYVSEKKD